jgi:asparagine synthase (glutamine-hydrolysing)
MCGIVGAAGPNAPDRSLLGLQIESLKHRGPDGSGFFLANNISLGMTRLAITGVQSGAQPVYSEDSDLVCVFNGEIYNFIALRGELIDLGYKFKTNSDSEIIPALYSEFGPNFVSKIEGMFAIAIWESKKETLFIARDKLGKKPLWYRIEKETLQFASEVKAFKAIKLKYKINHRKLFEFFQYGFVSAPDSLIEGIYQILPGSFAIWKNSKLEFTDYASQSSATSTAESLESAKNQLELNLQESILRRIPIEREYGIFLSSGFDSSLISALTSKLLQDPIRTYTVKFENSDLDESENAKSIARFLGLNHTTVSLSPTLEEIREILENIGDTPFGDSSLIPTFLLSKYASKEVAVILTGDGADEVFGGYPKYLQPRFLAGLDSYFDESRKFRGKKIALKFLRSRIIYSIISNITVYRYRRWHRMISITRLLKLLSFRTILLREVTAIYPKTDRHNSYGPSRIMQEIDMKFYLAGDILHKLDIASMANGLEARSPYLDSTVVKLGLEMNTNFKICNEETKFILKKLAREYIPSELLDRPKKGFSVPKAEWLRTICLPLLESIINDDQFAARRIFKPKRVKKMLYEHLNGRDFSTELWLILCFEIWARKWIDD